MERDAIPEDFVGKTIVAVDTSSWNIWRFKFSDGTAIAIEAENRHAAGAGLQVCDECAEDDEWLIYPDHETGDPGVLKSRL